MRERSSISSKREKIIHSPKIFLKNTKDGDFQEVILKEIMKGNILIKMRVRENWTKMAGSLFLMTSKR